MDHSCHLCLIYHKHWLTINRSAAMKRELGIAKCGLACCLCSENTTCGGCDAGDCPVPPRPKNLPVTRYLCLLDFFRQVIIIKNVIFGNEVLPRRCRNRFYELMTSAFTQKSFLCQADCFCVNAESVGFLRRTRLTETIRVHSPFLTGKRPMLTCKPVKTLF